MGGIVKGRGWDKARNSWFNVAIKHNSVWIMSGLIEACLGQLTLPVGLFGSLGMRRKKQLEVKDLVIKTH